MQMSWAEKIERKGHKEGVLEGKQDTLLRLLATKFGPLPEKTVSRIRAIETLLQLDRYLDRVLVAGSLEEMKLDANRSKK